MEQKVILEIEAKTVNQERKSFLFWNKDD